MKAVLAAVALALTGLVAGCISVTDEQWNYAKTWGWPVEASPRAQAYAHYIAATAYDRHGDQSSAIREMEQVAKLDPDSATPTLRLVRSFVRQQDYEHALEMSQRSVKQRPDHANLWIVLGEVNQQLKRYDDAEAAFRKAIELDPDSVLGYGALAELQENTNDLIPAIDLYHHLIEMNPEAAGLYYQLGLNLARIKDTEGARAALTRAVELSPRLLMAHRTLGILCLEAGDNREAEKQLGQYLTQRPDDDSGREALAGALTRMEKFTEANTCFDRLMASEQAKPQYNIEAMYCRLVAGKPVEAEERVPATGAPFFATLFTALARQAKGEAYKPLLESLDGIDGNLDQECNDYLNGLLYLFGKESAGKWMLDKIQTLRQDVDARTLAIIHARTLMSLERHAEAVAILTPLIKGNDADKWPHYYLAISHEKLKNNKETEAHLVEYLKYNPDDADGMNFLGYFYADQGMKLDKAEELIRKALKSSPESPFYLDSLGWVHFKRGKADDAIECIQKAIYRMDTDDAVLRDHLGDAYLLKGDKTRAVAEWERARRLDPKLEGVQKKIDKHKPAK